MSSDWVARSLERGLENGCADDIEEGLCNLRDGTCDALELIPLLERVANGSFHFFDDNSAGGFPHPTGSAVGFSSDAREAIRNIRENSKLASGSPIARSLKSASTEDVRRALEGLTDSDSTDETLIPILEKIARKDAYDSYSYSGGRSITDELGQAARTAIRRIRENRKAAGLPVKICPACDSIPDLATAHAGREKEFGASAASLRRHELDQRDDLWECAECGALFYWHAVRHQYDPEALIRFLSIHAVVLRELLQPNAPADDPAALAGRLLALPRPGCVIAGLLLVQRNRPLARQLVPVLVDAAAREDAGAANLLWRFSGTPDDARFILGVVEAQTPPAASLEWLRKHARVVSCSICSSIRTDSPPKLRRSALQENLPQLRQLGASERNDVLECPGCASLFHWQSEDGIEGGLTWIRGKLADALSKFIHRTGASAESAIETLFATGPEWQQLLAEYGMRHDHQLVMRLVPHMVSSLAAKPYSWLYDTLCEIARDPYGASTVRAALPPKISRQNREIRSLAKKVVST
ncbi:MAG TPA: hypothetical protein VL180_08930 [Burkholderiales bacterium]|nr:hypothetical protein [Burkholderiales bacterium]